MAEETLMTPPPSAEVAVVSDVPEPEKVETCEKEAVSPVPVKEPEMETEKEAETETVKGVAVVNEKKALEELKKLVQEALNKHEFTPPPQTAAPVAEEKPTSVVEKEVDPCEDLQIQAPVPESVVECKDEEKVTPPPPSAAELPEKVVTEVIEKPESCIDEDGAKKIEAIQETIVKTEPPPPSPPCTAEETVLPPEKISIWGIPLLADSRSDVILLKFLQAREYKVKEAFTMLKNVIKWRKEFDIESLMEQDLVSGEKSAYMHGVDKQGHPVCYNVFDQEMFSDEEKRKNFLRWRIQFLEKSVRKLDFGADGVSTIFQVNDLKYSPAPMMKELRQVFHVLQDNYPEFVAKQVFINVPWWYIAFYKIINPFFTQRTKSKFVFASPSKTTETLFKYISPEFVPVKYGGISREGEQEFTASDSITEEIVKPSCELMIELTATQACTLVWEARVVGSEISYGAEFVPSAENGYTIIIQKSRKVSDDESVMCGKYKCGEAGKVVLTFYNQSSKKKKVLYRFKTKLASE